MHRDKTTKVSDRMNWSRSTSMKSKLKFQQILGKIGVVVDELKENLSEKYKNDNQMFIEDARLKKAMSKKENGRSICHLKRILN